MVAPRRRPFLLVTALCLLAAGVLVAATIVPNEVQQPGTQPGEVAALESPDKCDNCHGGYDSAVEPAHNWRGSMMANAGRDPIFWATVAIAEQDFDGAGDLCIRCHSTGGWYAGRSTPTDGSGLTVGDADGVDCDTCHKMTDPDNSEWAGIMRSPFIANDKNAPPTGYYGSGMLSLWGGTEKLGPYSDPAARHGFLQSRFHRSRDFCGSCHDVSNPVVGDLAHNNGAQVPLAPGTFSGVPGGPLAQKAAFNNFPYQYGVVERTFSEYKAGLLSQTRVSAYGTLPAELQAGAIRAAFESAKGDYADGTPRYFTCQTCHLQAVTGKGANKPDVPLRTDLPLHDMTGGNYWMPDAILYQNSQGQLRLGGALTTGQIAAIQAGKSRAQQQLRLAASLSLTGNTLRITNLTAHKLISGYPEGRRMWVNVRWYDALGAVLREDGKYAPLAVMIDGVPATVNTILDLSGANTRIYEAHYAMTQEWASQLLALGKPAGLPLAYDRLTGAVESTLGELAAQAPGTNRETFHFVLNNHIVKDNRIPPYGMSYDEARKRNALPVPASQYGDPGAGGAYAHWDTLALNPPAGAVSASIRLLYQPTSWEYVQFLYLANTRQNAFLGNEGVKLLQTWQNTGMAEPYVMASVEWVAPAIATMTSPAPNSTLPGTTATFQWTSGSGVTAYRLSVGSTPGGTNYYDQVFASSLSATVSGLPTNGASVHVRLWSQVAGAWSYNDYAYTAATFAPAVMTSPAPGSTLPGSSVTFQWSAGSGVSAYQLSVGSTRGGSEYYLKWFASALSVTVEGLPTNGQLLYVRLWSYIAGAWQYRDYTYTAAGAPAPAAITSPTPGTTLPGSSVTFQWSAGSGVSAYQLSVGSTRGGSEYYLKWFASALSVTVNGLPTNGLPVYVRLWSYIGSAWQYRDYTYTAAGVPAPAAITSPTPGSTLPGSSVTFQWSAGSGVSAYQLSVGSARGGSDYYLKWFASALSVTVDGLPTNGLPVYVRLWSYIGGAWQYRDYTYTAAGVTAPAVLLSPAPGSVLPGGSVTFEWSAGSGVSAYQISIGSVRGGKDYFEKWTSGLTVTATGLPTNGSTVYVRLWSYIAGSWRYNDYVYVAASSG